MNRRVIAAVFVLLVMVLGVVAAAGSCGRSDERQQSSPAVGGVGGAGEAGDDRGVRSVEDVQWAGRTADRWGPMSYTPADSRGELMATGVLERSDAEAATAVPQGVVWQYTTIGDDIAAVPFSTTDGPTRVDGGVPAGYARTAAGAALVAATNVSAMLGWGSGGLEWLSTRGDAKALVEENRHRAEMDSDERVRDIMRAQNADLSDRDTCDRLRRIPVPEGFTVEAFDGSYARINIVLHLYQKGQQVWTSMPLDLAWVDGDWTIDYAGAAADQAPQGSLEPIPGVIRWGA